MNSSQNKSLKKNHKAILLAAFVSMCARPGFHWTIQTKHKITIRAIQIVTHIYTAHIY